MRPLGKILFSLLLGLIAGCGNRPEIVAQKKEETQRQLKALGEPVVSQTVTEMGYMVAPPSDASEPAWFQIDLRATQRIDQIALIPVRGDWYVLGHLSFNFPSRFRVDVSNDEDFHESQEIATYMDHDLPAPGLSPVVFEGKNSHARYVRVTVFEPRIFTLAEIMVLSGKRNIAINCPLKESRVSGYLPRWNGSFLVDGRSPLGTPVLSEPCPYDGALVGPLEDDAPLWMKLDLGSEQTIQEIRMHPIHGRMGVDFPGYKFPQFFRIETANTPDFETAQVVFETESPFPLPGNNVVTIPLLSARGRYVRIVVPTNGLEKNLQRFGLSEIEIFAGGENVARTAIVETAHDPLPLRKDWPKTVLIDGYSSFGKILDLPEWLNNWTERKRLQSELQELSLQHVNLLELRSRRQWVLSGALGSLFLIGIILLMLNFRRVQQRELARFRRNLAQNLHDEVGSNLAAIGMISEAAQQHSVPPGPEYWQKIHQISQETTDAMRETLWLSGGTVETRLDLMKHLKLTATRMLPNRKVEWVETPNEFPAGISGNAKREIFLFFKEALANVVRHSRATIVTISVREVGGHFEMKFHDNGRGFSTSDPSRGMGLESLKDRATRLGGTFTIESAPDQGTRIVLQFRI